MHPYKCRTALCYRYTRHGERERERERDSPQLIWRIDRRSENLLEKERGGREGERDGALCRSEAPLLRTLPPPALLLLLLSMSAPLSLSLFVLRAPDICFRSSSRPPLGVVCPPMQAGVVSCSVAHASLLKHWNSCSQYFCEFSFPRSTCLWVRWIFFSE